MTLKIKVETPPDRPYAAFKGVNTAEPGKPFNIEYEPDADAEAAADALLATTNQNLAAILTAVESFHEAVVTYVPDRDQPTVTKTASIVDLGSIIALPGDVRVTDGRPMILGFMDVNVQYGNILGASTKLGEVNDVQIPLERVQSVTQGNRYADEEGRFLTPAPAAA